MNEQTTVTITRSQLEIRALNTLDSSTLWPISALDGTTQPYETCGSVSHKIQTDPLCRNYELK